MQESRFLRDVLERAVAFVMKQDVLPPAGDEDVVESVVVVIANRDPRGPDASPQSGTLGHVAEGSVAVVVVELDGRFGGGGAGAGGV